MSGQADADDIGRSGARRMVNVKGQLRCIRMEDTTEERDQKSDIGGPVCMDLGSISSNKNRTAPVWTIYK